MQLCVTVLNSTLLSHQSGCFVYQRLAPVSGTPQVLLLLLLLLYFLKQYRILMRTSDKSTTMSCVFPDYGLESAAITHVDAPCGSQFVLVWCVQV